jgi:tRNA(fMet)-specific endonuclease VapC
VAVKVLLDTNAYAAFKRGREQAIAIVQRAASIGLPSVVLGELLGGFALGSKEAENKRDLKQFFSSPRVQVLSVDEHTASHYAAVYASLKRKGRPIPTNDLWIAATALQHGYVLYSYDAHFAEIDGLVVTSDARGSRR